jgi:endonuclease IV
MQNIESNFPDLNWGICIDTAHLHGSGISIQKSRDTNQWLDKLKMHLGVIAPKVETRPGLDTVNPERRNSGRIALIHFNGSQVRQGSGRDIHAPAFSELDMIWKLPIKNSGAEAMIKFAKKYNIPVIQEIKGEPLPEVMNIIRK